MMNMKAAASLTGSLLARKGAAYPASYSAPTVSPDGTSDASAARAYNDPRVIASAPPAPVAPTAFSAAEPQSEQLQDGRFAPTPVDTPREEPTVAVTPEVDPASAYKPASTFRPTAAPVGDTDMDAVESVGLPQTMDKMGRVRLSVRLDPDRYLRVKMASARTRWSAQDIVIAALDRYLGDKSGSAPDAGENNDGDNNHGNLN